MQGTLERQWYKINLLQQGSVKQFYKKTINRDIAETRRARKYSYRGTN